jgi:iron complex outermembrane receptor protein
MKKNLFKNQTYMVFKKWARKPFAVFNSLSKEVKIGGLIAGYTMLFTWLPATGQTDTINYNQNIDLEEVSIVEDQVPDLYSISGRNIEVINREDIAQLPVHNVQDLLEHAFNIDIRQRGSYGTQADVLIRGGSFNQVLILLNGANITDPHTGHYNLNLPLDLESIEKIEVLYGPGSRKHGPNAFSGVINFITKPSQTDQLSVLSMAGEHKLRKNHIELNLGSKNLRNMLSLTMEGSDGYTINTDFTNRSVFYHGTYSKDHTLLSLQGGYKEKQFGANSFYTPSFPYQYEDNRSLFASIKLSTGKKLKFTPQIYWRRHYDRFELLREDRAYYTPVNSLWINHTSGDTIPWYKNHYYHQTDVTGLNADFEFEFRYGTTNAGIDLRNERILSTTLGNEKETQKEVFTNDSLEYDYQYTRSYISGFVDHLYQYGNLVVSGGLMLNAVHDSSFNYYFLPGFDAAYYLTNSTKLIFSYNESMRLPTFTELFYNGPANKGYAELTAERASTFEGGISMNTQHINLKTTGFYRMGRDIIDYHYIDSLRAYKAVAYPDFNTFGLEVNTKANLSDVLGNRSFVKLNYTWIKPDKSPDRYNSKYVLDYLEHKLDITLNHRIFANLYGQWNYSFQQREGKFEFITEEGLQFFDYDEQHLLNFRLYWKEENFSAFVEASNLLDEQYLDAGSVYLPGRWIKGGVKISLDL